MITGIEIEGTLQILCTGVAKGANKAARTGLHVAKNVKVTAGEIYDSPQVQGIIGDGFEKMSESFKTGRKVVP